jgi:hypothetical protein
VLLGNKGARARSPSRRRVRRRRRAAGVWCSRIFRSVESVWSQAGWYCEDGGRRRVVWSPVLLFAAVGCALIPRWKIWGWGVSVLVLVAGVLGRPSRSRCGAGAHQCLLQVSSSLAGRGGEGRARGGGWCWFQALAAGLRGQEVSDLAVSLEAWRRWAQVRSWRSLGTAPGRCSFSVLRSSPCGLVDIAAQQSLVARSFFFSAVRPCELRCRICDVCGREEEERVQGHKCIFLLVRDPFCKSGAAVPVYVSLYLSTCTCSCMLCVYV